MGLWLNSAKSISASRVILLVSLLALAFPSNAQETSSVKAEIDTTQIKIGEQIKYKITVETDSLNLVYFPEDQTFSPLEMVEALKIDTTKKKDRVTLQRIYALTQFDSGAYIIPQQRIAINEEPFLTDSFKIRVADVAVDTTKQKLFDIKPLVVVERSYTNIWKWVLGILAFLLLIGALVYWFFLRTKPLTEEEKVSLLPAYDRALLQLKELENSRYLIQDQYKKYYSELTNIVRSYLEEEVNVSALESTTDQLIERLELLKDAGELELDIDTLTQFKKVLQTADLVKFAKSKPDMNLAEADRKSVEFIVVKTKESLPEPTEEELQASEEYAEELARKKKRKQLITAAVVFFGLVLLGGGTATYILGFREVKDTLTGHPTKKLLEQEWVTSNYGFPLLTISSPDVLVRTTKKPVFSTKFLDTIADPQKRQAAEKLLEEMTEKESGLSEFVMDTDKNNFYVHFEDISIPLELLDETVGPSFLERSEKSGDVKNMIVKDDEFYTPKGASGIKQYGTLSFKNDNNEFDRKQYTHILFANEQNVKRLTLMWNNDDVYADKIVERLLASLEINAE